MGIYSTSLTAADLYHLTAISTTCPDWMVAIARAQEGKCGSRSTSRLERAQDHNGNLSTGKILLILKPLINANQHVEKWLGKSQQFAVRHTRPSCFLNSAAAVAATGKKCLQFPWGTLIQENIH